MPRVRVIPALNAPPQPPPPPWKIGQDWQKPRYACLERKPHKVEVDSDSRIGVVHYVWLGDAQHMSTCSCEDFTYRKDMLHQCKHIKQEERRRCQWRGTDLVDGRCPMCLGPVERIKR